MKNHPQRAFVFVVAALLAACGGGKNQGAAAGGPPEVGVITLAAQPVALSTELPGRTAAYRIAEVRPQVEGIIKRRPEIASEISSVLATRRVELATAREGLDSAAKSQRFNNEQNRILHSIRHFFALADK